MMGKLDAIIHNNNGEDAILALADEVSHLHDYVREEFRPILEALDRRLSAIEARLDAQHKPSEPPAEELPPIAPPPSLIVPPAQA